jgi:hypothetical protein
MLRAFLPDGADGRGRWLQQDLDAAINKSCVASMHEYLAKDRDATVQDYAKTIKRVTNVLKVSWEENWAGDCQLGSQVVKGHDMKALLEYKFMEPTLWEAIHTRISDWATRLQRAAEQQGDPQPLHRILFGRSPQWWWHCQQNGFAQGSAEVDDEITRQLKMMLPAVGEASAPIYALDMFLQIAESVKVQITVTLASSWREWSDPTPSPPGTWTYDQTARYVAPMLTILATGLQALMFRLGR